MTEGTGEKEWLNVNVCVQHSSVPQHNFCLDLY